MGRETDGRRAARIGGVLTGAVPADAVPGPVTGRAASPFMLPSWAMSQVPPDAPVTTITAGTVPGTSPAVPKSSVPVRFLQTELLCGSGGRGRTCGRPGASGRHGPGRGVSGRCDLRWCGHCHARL
ncbi:hypothetical protein Misp01_41680 [Microtetraspora sp. NBRC 13810]|nr:hypothetical protein Misp01_41680 [Microtetraspora sp. NBRC 13810]